MQQTSGPSMLPTILVNDGVIWNPRYARGRGLRVNDMVAAWSPYEPGGSIVKRVVGMPGDVVCVLRKHGAKGEGEDESEGRYIVVPSGHCWVEGDNVPWSVDSRHYGPLPLGLVAGKVVAIRGAKPWSWRWVGNERLDSVEVEDVFGD
jgi:inner membrane protease subunit 1